MPHGTILLVTSAVLPKPELLTDLGQFPVQKCRQGQVNLKANRLSCSELVMLVYPMYYISTPGLKHHTQRLRWQGARLPQICLLCSIGTLVRLKHQVSLTSKACPARGSFKQPECNIPLILGKNKRPFGLWYLFIHYLHCSGSKAVARQALKQSERQTTTQLFHTNMWESPKSTSKHGEDLLKSMVLDGSYFSFLARVNLSQGLLKAHVPQRKTVRRISDHS